MPKLFLDMDGVLADFNGAAARALNASPEQRQEAAQQGRWLSAAWTQLKSYPHFYRHLPKTEIADQLVQVARQFRDQLGWQIAILTAIPRANDRPEAFQDKVEWVLEHYPDLPVYFGPYSRDKALHVSDCRDILVDDRQDNCQDWQKRGARAILVQDHQRSAAVTELELALNNENSQCAD